MVADADEHFEADRVVDRIGHDFTSAAQLDDCDAKLLGIDREHVAVAVLRDFVPLAERRQNVEVSALGRDHFAELGGRQAGRDFGVEHLPGRVAMKGEMRQHQ